MIKLPENFNLSVNLKRAVANGMFVVLFLSLYAIKDPVILGSGFIFGALGGSTTDIAGWLGNRQAIEAFNAPKPEEGDE